jgi:hypothetical protein
VEQSKKTPWDAGDLQPALRQLFGEHAQVLPSQGRALVPGSGSGYDVNFLASKGFEATGLDMSETATGRAEEVRLIVQDPYPAEYRLQRVRGVNVSPGTASFVVGDFFTFDHGANFVFGYDYTFLCALPPSLRENWAARWAQLLNPGGNLATLVFPIDGPRDDGPPYALTVELVDGLLGGMFDRVLEFAPKEGARKDKQRMVLWRRKV